MKMKKNLILFAVLFLTLILNSKTINSKTIIGKAEYPFGDNESVIQAKKRCKTEAIKNAVESFATYIESETEVKNYITNRDLLVSKSLGLLQNIIVIDENIDRKNGLVYFKIQGEIDEEVILYLLRNNKPELKKNNDISLIKEKFELAKRLTKTYYRNKRNIVIKDKNIAWFDLVNNSPEVKDYKEFYVKHNTKKDPYSFIIDVFTTRFDKFKNIYSLKGYFDESAYVKDFQFNKKRFVIIYKISGQGAYLAYEIFNYDGIGKLNPLFGGENYCQGKLFVDDNNILITSGRGKFEIKYINDKFKVVPYNKPLILSKLSNDHLLKYSLSDDNILNAFFNSKIIKFEKIKKDFFVSNKIFTIFKNEKIILDDSDNKNNLKVLVSGNYMNFDDGKFTTIIPMKDGMTGVSVGNSSVVYNIKFKIK